MGEFSLKALLKLDKSNFDKNTKGATSQIKSMGKLVAGAAFSGAIALGVKNAIAEFAEFENKMKAVQTLLDGDARAAIQGFTNDILEMTTRIPVGANDLAESLFDVISAGVGAGDAMAFLEEAGKLAVAGVTDTKTAVDGMTSAYNAFSKEGLSASEIADRFFAAQKEGKTTIAELSSSIGKVAPIAASMNMTLSETLGVIAKLTKSGIQTKEAVTGMKAAISNILKPTEDAIKLAKKYNFQFDESALKSKGFGGVLKDVKEQVDKGNLSYSDMFGSVEALNSVLALAEDNFVGLNKIQEKVANSTGIANEKFEEQKESLSNQLKLIQNNSKKIRMELTQAFLPMLLSVSEAIINVFDSDIINDFAKNLTLGAINMRAEFKLFGLGIDRVMDSFTNMKQAGKIAVVMIATEVKIAALKIKSIWKDTTADQVQIRKDADLEIEQLNRESFQKAADNAGEVAKVRNQLAKDTVIVEKRYTATSKEENDKRKEKSKETLEAIKKAAEEKLITDADSVSESTKKVTTKTQDELDDQKKKFEKHLDDLKTLGGAFATDFQTGLNSLVDMAMNGENGLVSNMQGALTGFVGPDVASFMAGFFGGVITDGISKIVTGIFGSTPVKTVAETAAQTFERMTVKFNRSLDKIGREQSVTEKEIDILQELKEQGKKFIPAEIARVLGESTFGISINDALIKRFDKLSGFEDTSLSFKTDIIQAKQDEIDTLLKSLGITNLATADLSKIGFGDLGLIAKKNQELQSLKNEQLLAPLENILNKLNIQQQAADVTKLATGGSFNISRPTMIGKNIMAGEAGPERITVEPMNQSRAGNATIIIQAGGQNPTHIANSVKSVLDDPFFTTSKGVNQAV